MDFNTEASFIKECVKKEFQDRLIYELQSKKHREKAKARFAHSSENMLKNDFSRLTISDFESYININKNDSCYIIGDSFDGEILSLKDAFEYLKTSYTLVILICSRFIAIKEEFESKPPLLFLYNK